MNGVTVEPCYGLFVIGTPSQLSDAILPGRGFAARVTVTTMGILLSATVLGRKTTTASPNVSRLASGCEYPGRYTSIRQTIRRYNLIGRSVRANRKPQSGNKRAETAFFMSFNFAYHKLYMLSACPENNTTEETLLFYQMIQRYKFHKVSGRKEEKKRDGCCNHLVLLIPRPLLFSRNRAALRRLLAVRRGFYQNPRNSPCIKRLHALPKVAGYTLVT